MESHLHDLDRSKITDLDKFLKKPHNVLHLKILKLISYSNYLTFCAHVTWWQDFATLTIRGFSLHSFSTQNTQLLLLVPLKKLLNWPKTRNGFFLQNNKIVKRGNFVTDVKIFTSNNFYNFHCVYRVHMILANSQIAIIPSHFDAIRYFFCKWCKFCYFWCKFWCKLCYCFIWY